MAIFDLFRFDNCKHFPDSYAVDRESLYRLFRPTLIEQLSQSKTVVLSLHFPAEFFVLQDLLSEWGIEYTLITRPLDRQWFQDNRAGQGGRLFLSLAEFLIATEFSGDEPWDAPLALMILDRHPLYEKDEALIRFANSFPGTPEVGYFLSFKDHLVARLIDHRLLELLLQIGAKDHGLIASAMLSKRLKKMLIKTSRNFTGPEQPTESAKEWYQRNAPKNQ